MYCLSRRHHDINGLTACLHPRWIIGQVQDLSGSHLDRERPRTLSAAEGDVTRLRFYPAECYRTEIPSLPVLDLLLCITYCYVQNANLLELVNADLCQS